MGESGEPGDGEAGEYDENIHKLLERMAARNQQALEQLPGDPAGRIKELNDYEFMDPAARQKFQDLLAFASAADVAADVPGDAAGVAEHVAGRHAGHA